MRPDDFYIDEPSTWGSGIGVRSLNTTLLDQLRRGPIDGRDDVEAAAGLARLIHDDLEKYGTGGVQEMTEPEMRQAILALHAMVERAGVANFALPFRDYGTFKGYWLRNDGYGSWQARRDLLNDLFDPLHERLVELETRALSSTLAQPISPRPVTGWTRIDAELAELRRHFQIARSEQDYRTTPVTEADHSAH